MASEVEKGKRDFSEKIDLSYLGCEPARAFRNTAPAELIERALRLHEGELSDTGALMVDTRPFTGRAPSNRFIVDSKDVHGEIAWGDVNQPMAPEEFDDIWKRALEYINGRDMFVFDGIAGANRNHSKRVRVICEKAYQCLFAHQLLVRPTTHELEDFGEGDYTLLALPDFEDSRKVDGKDTATVAIDFANRRIIVAGTRYSGEIKKSVFSAMSYEMTRENVLPMHCSASVDRSDGSVAVFFGLSGTGKTTLSSDPTRSIVGDDEHGWGDDGIFNFEGGCYAKCIDLTEESEPEIYRAVRFGAIAENVIVNEATRAADFSDGRITDNTRVAYPIDFIPDSLASGMAGAPSVIFFLTADAYGVLPPISRLSPKAAMYHFISGFTSKVAGTEVGVREPVPTFSSMFGEPFMPRPASVYAHMLENKLNDGETEVYLVNTGWVGGSASDGASRIPLVYTRTMINAACKGKLLDAPTEHNELFGLDAILEVPGVPTDVLNPRRYWADCGRTEEEYDKTAKKLSDLFKSNFEKKHQGTI